MGELPKSRENSISKIVASSEEASAYVEGFLEGRAEVHKTWVAKVETKKSPETEEIIDHLISELKGFVESYGGTFAGLDSDDIHIIDPDHPETKKLTAGLTENGLTGVRGLFQAEKNWVLIFMSDQKDFQTLAEILTHELMHANSFNSFEGAERVGVNGYTSTMNTEDRGTVPINIRQRRSGLHIATDSEKPGETSNGMMKLNEAVITELKIRFMNKFFSDIEHVSDEYSSTVKAALSPDQLKKYRKISSVEVAGKDGGSVDIVRVQEHEYPAERAMLAAEIDAIIDSGKTEYTEREEVFNLFAKAAMSGELLPLARVIEKVHGPGSFRAMVEGYSVGPALKNKKKLK